MRRLGRFLVWSLPALPFVILIAFLVEFAVGWRYVAAWTGGALLIWSVG